MDYFAVKNYEKFQHYKDRRPPWIKLYNELLDDYEFSCLQDASKLHLILIWLLASRHDNRLPWDSNWIAARIGATEKVNLEALESSGFIKRFPVLQDASKTLASCPGNAIPETETETEKRDGAIAPLRVLSFWDVGESLGISRSTIGRMIRDHGEDAVSDALRNLSLRAKRPADATQYLKGMLKSKKADDPMRNVL